MIISERPEVILMLLMIEIEMIISLKVILVILMLLIISENVQVEDNLWSLAILIWEIVNQCQQVELTTCEKN